MGLVRGLVIRPALAIAWGLVLWGTFLDGWALYQVVAEGPSAAFRTMAGLSGGNLACMGAAALVWLVLFAGWLDRRRTATEG